MSRRPVSPLRTHGICSRLSPTPTPLPCPRWLAAMAHWYVCGSALHAASHSQKLGPGACSSAGAAPAARAPLSLVQHRAGGRGSGTQPHGCRAGCGVTAGRGSAAAAFQWTIGQHPPRTRGRRRRLDGGQCCHGCGLCDGCAVPCLLPSRHVAAARCPEHGRVQPRGAGRTAGNGGHRRGPAPPAALCCRRVAGCRPQCCCPRCWVWPWQCGCVLHSV